MNIIEITLPPLRERGVADIEAPALHFIKRYCPGTPLTAGALDKLVSYGWPGNVRELENTIQRGLPLCDNKKLQAAHIAIERKAPSLMKGKIGTLQQMEQEMIDTTLSTCKRNMVKMAKC